VLRSLDSCPTDADSALPLTDHADARARWLNAEALAALGPTPKRSRVGDVAPDASGFDVASMAPAYLSRAAIHAERGETQLSVQTCERAVTPGEGRARCSSPGSARL